MSPRLTLTVLVENSALKDHVLCGEAGLSFILETAGKKILFDTGLSGMWMSLFFRTGISITRAGFARSPDILSF